MTRTCPWCKCSIEHRDVRARFCERRQCYANYRHWQKMDNLHRDEATALAIQVVGHGMKATVVRSDVHGWCVRARLPHGPEVFFTDADDLRFFLVDSGRVAA